MTATRSNPECVVEEAEEEEGDEEEEEEEEKEEAEEESAALVEEEEEEEEEENCVCGSLGLRANKALFGKYLFFFKGPCVEVM